MKNGDRIKCPLCGENTVVKERSVRRDFLAVTASPGNGAAERELYCMFCSGCLGDAASAAVSGGGAAKTELGGLAALLGGLEEKKCDAGLDFSVESRVFCRDCEYFVEHPFQPRCAKHERNADPMGDCQDYARNAHDEIKKGE